MKLISIRIWNFKSWNFLYTTALSFSAQLLFQQNFYLVFYSVNSFQLCCLYLNSIFFSLFQSRPHIQFIQWKSPIQIPSVVKLSEYIHIIKFLIIRSYCFTPLTIFVNCRNIRRYDTFIELNFTLFLKLAYKTHTATHIWHVPSGDMENSATKMKSIEIMQ